MLHDFYVYLLIANALGHCVECARKLKQVFFKDNERVPGLLLGLFIDSAF